MQTPICWVVKRSELLILFVAIVKMFGSKIVNLFSARDFLFVLFCIRLKNSVLVTE